MKQTNKQNRRRAGRKNYYVKNSKQQFRLYGSLTPKQGATKLSLHWGKRQLSTAVITSGSEAQGPCGCKSTLQRAAEHHQPI